VEPERRSPYLFVVGCPRSGTTMLQRMLDHHRDLAVANDSHFLPRVTKAWTTGGEVPVDSALVTEMTDFTTRSGRTGFFKLGLSEEQVRSASASATNFREFACALYEALAQSRGKRFGAEKTPDYVRCIPLLHELFPWARFVHLLRDGRDVALALLDWARAGKGPGVYPLWSVEPVAVAALWWKRQVLAGRRDGRILGDELYHEVRFEDLVRTPDACLMTLCDFLHLEYDPGMLEYHQGRARLDRALSSNKAWLPPTPGRREWRTQMKQRDVALFEYLAGDVMSDVGYQLDIPAPSAEIRTLAGRCQAWWNWKAGG
jgi:hypothetical protein